MRVPEPWRWVLFAAALVAFASVPTVMAEEDPEPEPPSAEEEGASEPEPLSAEEARRLATLLQKASKKRKGVDVLPALDEVGERFHPTFVKPLLKMLTHSSTEVAMRAADLLAIQRVEREKDRKKLVKSIWKSGWTHHANHKRPVVKGRALVAAATQEGGPLAPKFIKEVGKLWRSIVGNPNEALAPVLVSICEYVRMTKDKRLCRLLAEQIDEPGATAVDSPSNPPREWWERRWKMWKQVKAEVVETLEELTGESFKSTAVAKEWFRAHEKEFGFRW